MVVDVVDHCVERLVVDWRVVEVVVEVVDVDVLVLLLMGNIRKKKFNIQNGMYLEFFSKYFGFLKFCHNLFIIYTKYTKKTNQKQN